MHLKWLECPLTHSAWYLDDLDKQARGAVPHYTGICVILCDGRYEVHSADHLTTLPTLDEAKDYAVVVYRLGVTT